MTQCFLLREQAPFSVNPSPQSVWKMPVPQLPLSRASPITLEKHMSHLLAISIYLAAWVWLTWKTQSTCLSPLRNQPLLCNLQPPSPRAHEATAELASGACGTTAGLDHVSSSFVKGESIFSASNDVSCHLPPKSQLTLSLPRSGKVRCRKAFVFGREKATTME